MSLWEIRKAVKPWLSGLTSETILFGCSGGADSMSLAVALLNEAGSSKVIPVVVDHDLQKDSAEIAVQTVSKLKTLGYSEVVTARANVEVTDGLEASARRARYLIFKQFIDAYQPKYFMLAHTLNDQAETVLLGLARGSGARSLSGMAVENNIFVRPLLKITRAQTVAACNEVGIEVWIDPHNSDERFARVKVRQNLLPIFEEKLGPGVTEALARTADLLRDDADALDDFANQFFAQVDPASIEIADLARLPKAIRTRVLRLAIYKAGAPSGMLTADHIAQAEALISEWHGQGEVSLPGNVKLSRNSGRITLSSGSN
ncbi:MAG: tRNA lysidine(34) synthetase TilS [Actinomycetes bacterium]